MNAVPKIFAAIQEVTGATAQVQHGRMGRFVEPQLDDAHHLRPEPKLLVEILITVVTLRTVPCNHVPKLRLINRGVCLCGERACLEEVWNVRNRILCEEHGNTPFGAMLGRERLYETNVPQWK